MCPACCCLQHSFPFMTAFNSYHNLIPISQTRRQSLQDQEIIFIITLHLKGKALYCTSCQPPTPFARNDKSILCLTKEQIQLLSFTWLSFYISSYGARALGERVFPSILFQNQSGRRKVFFNSLLHWADADLTICIRVKLGSDMAKPLPPSPGFLAYFEEERRKNIYPLLFYLPSNLLGSSCVILFNLQHKPLRDVQWSSFYR